MRTRMCVFQYMDNDRDMSMGQWTTLPKGGEDTKGKLDDLLLRMATMTETDRDCLGGMLVPSTTDFDDKKRIQGFLLNNLCRRASNRNYTTNLIGRR